MSTQKQFLEMIKDGAMQLWSKFGILPSVAAGQAALESGWGSSTLAIRYNNLFGIKGTYAGNSAMMDTWEVYGGKRYDIKDSFRVYPDWSTSILDYGVFLTVNKRYARAIGLSNYKDQIRVIHGAGYATDPQYANKVISIIEKYNLHEWDRKKDLSPTSPPSWNDYIIHKVVQGDNLTKIARKYNTTITKIVALNDIDNPNLIYVGQALKIPDDGVYYYVLKGDSLTKIGQQFGVSVNDLVKVNGIKNPNLIHVGQKLKIR